MYYLNYTHPIETISLVVESTLVWESILGITGFTHSELRHTFEFDEWWTSEQKSMSNLLIEHLEVIEKTNLWFGLILLQEKFSATSITDFSKRLNEMTMNEFYQTVLPYKDRVSEPIRKSLAEQFKDGDSFETYASYFHGHEYLEEYVLHLGYLSHQEICDLYKSILEEWYNWIIKNPQWDKWIRALDIEQKQYSSLESDKPLEMIEVITGGVKYIPEPSVWTVKMIPQVTYRPWTLVIRTPDTKLYFYPLNEKYLLEAGSPSTELVRGHKALGDEVRLKILYQLVNKNSSLQELSSQFNISKTTLHHQLSLLKAAKFIQVDKGVYSANLSQIHSFSKRLNQYLVEPI